LTLLERFAERLVWINDFQKDTEAMGQTHALVIDDNVQNSKILATLLTLQSVECTIVSHPNQLDAILANISQVDVVFLDLEMPDKDGYQVYKLLRSDPRFRTVPIVAYSVHTNEMNTVRQMGFHGFLGKPLKMAQFPDHLARILRGEQVWALS
jgi:CheY-like chemotaxis protein